MSFDPADELWDRQYRPELYGLFKRLGFQKFIEKWELRPAPEETVTAENAASLPRIDITESDMQTVFDALREAPEIAVAVLDGLDALELCDGKTVYALAWNTSGERYDELLKTLFSGAVKKRSHNVKNLMTTLLREGLSTEGFVFDTALAGYLLAATDNDYALERLSVRYLGTEMSGAEAIFALTEPLTAAMRAQGMLELYQTAELPLCEVLAEMEHTGFYVDRKALYDFGESLNAGIAALQESIFAHAGHEFNILSPKQLGEVLFDELLLPAGKKTKTGWSTNADVLEKLRGKHPIVQEILDYRMLTKLKSTYAEGLLKVIEPDGRIHTNFQMTVTATGRLSSTEPNLQNIPVRKELGAQIRRMFVASPGMTLVDADYSQIELRLLAHISGDKAMQEAFLSGEDFHTVTASQVFDTPIDEVTPTLRSRAKAVNFGIVYGISAFSLAQDIGVYPSEARAYMDAYLNKYHGVRDYMKAIVEKAREEGCVSTLYGRRRALPELKSANFNTRQFGERVALNMPIQGSAADIIKLAMVAVHRRLRAEGLKAKLILQVHDELIVECPEEEASRVCEILSREMEHVAELSVPLTAEAHVGHSWAEAH